MTSTRLDLKSSGESGSPASISSAEGSPVRTSPELARALACLVLEAASGTSSLESLRSSIRIGSSSRTSLLEPPSGSTPSEETWDGSGMRRYQSRLQRATSALRTAAFGSSWWLTPCSRDWKGPNPNPRKGEDLPTQVQRFMAEWATPTRRDFKGAFSKKTKGGRDLATDVARFAREFPTVTSGQYWTANNGTPRDGRTKYSTAGTPSLFTAGQCWPTVVVTDQASSGRATSLGQPGNTMKPGTSLTDAMREWLMCFRPSGMTSTGGDGTSKAVVLNPDFCRALMGFPEAWLDGVSPPSVTRSSRKTRKSSAG